jgi:hypothetical protein
VAVGLFGTPARRCGFDAKASELEDREIYFVLAEMEGYLSPGWQFTQNDEILLSTWLLDIDLEG